MSKTQDKVIDQMNLNCIDDLNEEKDRWFFMPGGGKVMFRTVPISEFKKMQKRTTKKSVDYKKVEGTPGRFEVETVDNDLFNELFWDYAIVSWDEFSFKHPDTKELILCTPDTCTKENKSILINCSKKFILFANESLKELNAEEMEAAKAEEKN